MKMFSVVISLLFTICCLASKSESTADQTSIKSLSVNSDNDMFSSSNDQDYSASFSIKITGKDFTNNPFFLDSLIDLFDEPFRAHSDGKFLAMNSAEIGMLLFTPRDIKDPNIIKNDRPYAGLFYFTSSKQTIASDEKKTWNSSITLGILGSNIPEEIQKKVHENISSSPIPRGWDNQISDGGEPTLKYQLASKSLLYSSKYLQLSSTLGFNIGYNTDVYAGLSTRFGILQTPWHSFNGNPGRIGGEIEPDYRQSKNRGSDYYIFMGAQAKAVAYNAMLQGQFRDSKHQYNFDEIRHTIFEGWVGLAIDFFQSTRLSFSHRVRSSEVSKGISDRSFNWGSLTLSYLF